MCVAICLDRPNAAVSDLIISGIGAGGRLPLSFCLRKGRLMQLLQFQFTVWDCIHCLLPCGILATGLCYLLGIFDNPSGLTQRSRTIFCPVHLLRCQAALQIAHIRINTTVVVFCSKFRTAICNCCRVLYWRIVLSSHSAIVSRISLSFY